VKREEEEEEEEEEKKKPYKFLKLVFYFVVEGFSL